MFKWILVLSLLAAASPLAQGKPVTVADFAGTWNIEFMSHQLALVIEPAEGNQATATMMVMGRDIPLKGELVDRTITFTGVKAEGAPKAGHLAQGPGARPIVVTLQEDGTLAGEMMTNNGPGKWTAEKLRPRRKPQP
jgi:hypothetical protein